MKRNSISTSISVIKIMNKTIALSPLLPQEISDANYLPEVELSDSLCSNGLCLQKRSLAQCSSQSVCTSLYTKESFTSQFPTVLVLY